MLEIRNILGAQSDTRQSVPHFWPLLPEVGISLAQVAHPNGAFRRR
jgi:hypothetical protein